MKLQLTKGSTSNILQIFIADSSSTTGAGLTGLAHNTSSLTAYYHRDTDTTATAISLVTMTVGTFTSSGFKEIDATNMPGWYQFCPPNTAFATGAESVGFHLKGATNMAPLPIEVQLITAASSAPSAATVAAAVWNEVQSGHTTAGTFGVYLDKAISSVGWSSNSNTETTLSRKMVDYIADRVWSYMLSKDRSAKTELLAKSEFNHLVDQVKVDFPDDSANFQEITTLLRELSSKDNGISSVLDAILSIEKPQDYTENLNDIITKVTLLTEALDKFPGSHEEFVKILQEFTGEMDETKENMETSCDMIIETCTMVEDMHAKVAEFTEKLDEQVDMDRRFAAMGGKLNEQSLSDLKDQLTKLEPILKALKFDVVDEMLRAQASIK